MFFFASDLKKHPKLDRSKRGKINCRNTVLPLTFGILTAAIKAETDSSRQFVLIGQKKLIHERNEERHHERRPSGAEKCRKKGIFSLARAREKCFPRRYERKSRIECIVRAVCGAFLYNTIGSSEPSRASPVVVLVVVVVVVVVCLNRVAQPVLGVGRGGGAFHRNLSTHYPFPTAKVFFTTKSGNKTHLTPCKSADETRERETKKTADSLLPQQRRERKPHQIILPPAVEVGSGSGVLVLGPDCHIHTHTHTHVTYRVN